jgi:hypothetical protein
MAPAAALTASAALKARVRRLSILSKLAQPEDLLHLFPNGAYRGWSGFTGVWSPEIIRRLGVIGMNTPVEVDIYAHANSTCVNGYRMPNGLGGSADFLRSAKYSIMHTPSSRPSKPIRMM